MTTPTKEISLPSGATLVVASAPFPKSKALAQAVATELRGVSIKSSETDTGEALKDFLCTAFASPAVERALAPCLLRCTYDSQKITDETFEPDEARGDYVTVCMEVVKHNVGPFGKSLYAAWLVALSAVTPNSPASRPRTMTSSSTSDSAGPATPAP